MSLTTCSFDSAAAFRSSRCLFESSGPRFHSDNRCLLWSSKFAFSKGTGLIKRSCINSHLFVCTPPPTETYKGDEMKQRKKHQMKVFMGGMSEFLPSGVPIPLFSHLSYNYGFQQHFEVCAMILRDRRR